MIPAIEAIKTICAWREDAVAVSATDILREWSSVSTRRDLDLDLRDCMERTASVGLGIALAHPMRRVLVLDSSSTLRANLSSLTTVGSAAPKNLVHFLFQDAGHISTGGRAIPGLDSIDFGAHAQAGGYSKTYHFDGLEEMVISLEEVLYERGPTFVLLRVVHGDPMPDYPSRTLKESFDAVRHALESGHAAQG